jgi:hypothetical protein
MLEGRNFRVRQGFDDERYVVGAALEKFGRLRLSLFDVVLDLEGYKLIIHP